MMMPKMIAAPAVSDITIISVVSTPGAAPTVVASATFPTDIHTYTRWRIKIQCNIMLYRPFNYTICSTWLPGLRSSARVTPQCTSTTALFDYISAGRSTHCAFYHWRPHLSSDCCIGLEQSAGVGPVVSVVASFPQQTENRTFCPVLQS